MTQTYRLAINRAEQTCFFILTWGEGMELTASVPYPHQLVKDYRTWYDAYYLYYRSMPKKSEVVDAPESVSGIRGRAGASGNVFMPHTELRSKLAQAGERLMAEFHRWLELGELSKIRKQLNRRDYPQTAATLFVSCDDADLRRLPWESWELSESSQHLPIRIARQPANIEVAANPPRKQRRIPRALVIIGDDTGLNFDRDLKAVAQLKNLVDVKHIGWKTGGDKHELIDEVRTYIRDPEGWDMLLFFGHSNEAPEVGGEIAIAPNTYLSMRELASDLTEAKRNGLQFALFNSCKGLDIANELVALGLNQVVIMREPIHNLVAQAFLLQFLQRMTQFDDVHTALQKTTKALKAEQSMAYPSAYLVPSLFSHRGAELFQLQPVGWRAKLAKLWPSRKQGMVLGAIAVLSLLPPVRDSLMAGRLWTQAVANHIVARPLQAEVSPPVLLVHVDEESIARGIPDGEANPINRAYLADLVDKVVELDSQLIGIDYLLDRRQDDYDQRLAESLERAVNEDRWLVMASDLIDKQEIGPQAELASPKWSMQGLVRAPASWHLKALQISQDCSSRCPFGYLLAITRVAIDSPSGERLVPSLERSRELRSELFETIMEENDPPLLKQLLTYRLSPILSLSRRIEQRWLQPILDFSLPPGHIYDHISAYELLELDLQDLRDRYDWQNQVVLIGSGGYSEAGVGDQRDYVQNPPAVQFWRDQTPYSNSRFTGVEAHAYMIHHFLSRHWVTPIPVLWMVGLGTILGAGSAFGCYRYKRLQRYRWQGLVGFSIGYGLIGIVMYSAVSIVLPWLLPTVAVWVYHIPSLKDSNQERNL